MEPKGNDMAGDELVERAIIRWSKEPQRDVMLPGLGMKTCGELADALRARLSRSTSTEAVAGWKLVPTKHDGRAGLTPEMFDAFWAAFHYSWERHGEFESVNAGYNAMLAAAPACPSLQGGAEPDDDAMAWAEIAEHYRSAMLMAEASINSLPMPVADGQTSAVWKRVSDASDILHTARQDMIHKHGTTFLNSGPIGPSSITYSLGETGGTETDELAAELLRLNKCDRTALLSSNARKTLRKAASALTSLRAERNRAQEEANIYWNGINDLAAKHEAAEASLAAEKLRVAEMEKLMEELPPTNNSVKMIAARNKALYAAEQRVTALVGALNRAQQRTGVFADMSPDEDETWESWYHAAFDMLAAEIAALATES